VNCPPNRGNLNGSAPFGFVLPKRLACRVGKGGGTDAPHGKVSRAPCPPSASMRLARPMVGTAHERQSFELKRVPTPLPTLQAGTRLWFRFAKSSVLRQPAPEAPPILACGCGDQQRTDRQHEYWNPDQHGTKEQHEDSADH